MKRYLIYILPLFLLFSCKSNFDKELDLLQIYLNDNNVNIDPKPSGLYYIETLEGTGEYPVSGNTVEVHYTGKLINGEQFDSSFDRGEPFIFILGYDSVIDGWVEGLSYMKKGGKATLIIPSNLAYGATGRGSTIPPYSTLVFEMELINITY